MPSGLHRVSCVRSSVHRALGSDREGAGSIPVERQTDLDTTRRHTGAVAHLGERCRGTAEGRVASVLRTGSSPASSTTGVVAQLGERVDRTHEVRGSTPLDSTAANRHLLSPPRGGMFQGGELALQVGCDGFDFHPLHHSASEVFSCWHPWLPTRRSGFDSRRALRVECGPFLVNSCDRRCVARVRPPVAVPNGTGVGLQNRHTRVRFPPAPPYPRGPTEGRRSSKPNGGGSNPSGGANYTRVAQTEERPTTNRKAGGSTPPAGAMSS